MSRLWITLSCLIPLMLAATPAFACGPSGEQMWILGLFIAPFMAIPYTLFGSLVIASQSGRWFSGRRFLRWLGGTLGAHVAATIGGAVGFAMMAATHALGMENDSLSCVLVLSTPFVFEIAYLMRLHSRRVLARGVESTTRE